MDDQIKLIDFEYGIFNLCLLDAPYGPYPFPFRSDYAPVTSQIYLSLERAYRTELSTGISQASNNDIYYTALIRAWISWLLRTNPDSPQFTQQASAIGKLSERADYLTLIGWSLRKLNSKNRA